MWYSLTNQDIRRSNAKRNHTHPRLLQDITNKSTKERMIIVSVCTNPLIRLRCSCSKSRSSSTVESCRPLTPEAVLTSVLLLHCRPFCLRPSTGEDASTVESSKNFLLFPVSSKLWSCPSVWWRWRSHITSPWLSYQNSDRPRNWLSKPNSIYLHTMR